MGSLLLRFLLPGLLFSSFISSYGQEPPPPPASDYFPATWKEVQSPAGFTVRFPGAPKEATKEYDSDHARLTLHSLYYGNGNFIFYSVDYRDYPKILSDSEIKELFVGIRRKRLEAWKTGRV